MTTPQDRIDALRAKVAEAGADAFVSLNPPDNQYLTGFLGSTSAVAVTEDQALFLCDFRYTEQAELEVDGNYTIEEVNGPLEQALGERLGAWGVNNPAFEPEVVTVAQLEKLDAALDGTYMPAPGIVSAMRLIKSPDEIERIRRAVQLSETVLEDSFDQLREGLTERELAAWFEYEFKKRGASGAAFDTIAAFGSHSSIVHYAPGDSPLKRGDAVLLDFGCRLDGYCSDLTRTYSFGTISDRWFEEIYDLALTAQRIAIEAVRPGLSCRELDAVARDLIDEGGYGERFGHGLGHGVGIDIHEGPRLNRDSNTTLEEGMVITIEPGIYLPERGGVRIEDLAVVTQTGCELLSSAPKELRILGA